MNFSIETPKQVVLDVNKKGMNFKIGNTQGPQGYSAYEIAVQNGFEGTEQEWLNSLVGKEGHSPIRGTDYWTEIDKKEIIDEVENYIDDYMGDIENILIALDIGSGV